MAVDVTAAPSGARTGAQFLDGLRNDGREVWMDGRKIEELFPRFNAQESLACASLGAEARVQLAALLRTLVTTIRGGT